MAIIKLANASWWNIYLGIKQKKAARISLLGDLFTNTVEPRFNEVAGDRPNLFVKSNVRYIEKTDVGKTRDDRTSVTVKMGKTRDRTVRDIYVTDP